MSDRKLSANWCEVCGFELDRYGVCAECGWDGYEFLTLDDGSFEPSAEEIAMLGTDDETDGQS